MSTPEDAGAWAGGIGSESAGNPVPTGEEAATPYGLSGPLPEYAAGVLVADRGTMAFEVDAYPPPLHPHMLPVDLSGIHSLGNVPHEPTHRRFDAPLVALVNQAAAGYSLIAAPNQGLHFIKVLACYITLDAAGTFKWVQGGLQTSADPAMSGVMNLGGAAVPPLQLPPAPPETPWLFTAPDQSLGIVTATGKAQGWVVYCYSPFDR